MKQATAKPDKIYTRLPGRGLNLSRHVRMFQSPDHFLQISSTGYTERYKRFYYRDIQAFVLARTHTGKGFNVVWILLGCLFSLPAIDQSGGTALILWSLGLFFFLCLGFNIWLGPTCICRLHTAVQTERLPALKRLRSSRKVLARLLPLIAAAQGALSQEELQRHWQSQSPGLTNVAGRASTPPQEDPNAPPVIS